MALGSEPLQPEAQVSSSTLTREVAETEITRFLGLPSGWPRTRISKGVYSDKERPEGFELLRTALLGKTRGIKQQPRPTL